MSFNRVSIIYKQLDRWNCDKDEHVEFNEEKFKGQYNPLGNYNNMDIILNFTIKGFIGSLWEGQQYSGTIIFTKNFPVSPPIVYIYNLFHPNVYKNGMVCISILHEGEDVFGYEDVKMRWTPAHNIGSIMRSILTLFDDPNCESPANVDASVLWSNDKEELKRVIKGSLFHSDGCL